MATASRERCIAELRELGLSRLEAAIYLQLLGQPRSTGYRVARDLGKPAANVYAALESLRTKGVVVLEQGGSRSWLALPVASLERQPGRPLQIESLGAGVLLLLHHAAGLEAPVEGSRWSHDIAGGAATGTAWGLSAVSIAALGWLWIRFARGEANPERLVRFTAAGRILLEHEAVTARQERGTGPNRDAVREEGQLGPRGARELHLMQLRDGREGRRNPCGGKGRCRRNSPSHRAR